ncbi:MAG: diguanylate cyclase [Defluviitaleaceae bacterium]|nr:diguanylate cyclase [Defluviitaleaceae bacterium]
MDASAARQCVLIINDVPMELRYLRRVLSPLYDVKLALSGEIGLELALDQTVDLILLDVVMSGMSGFDVLSRLKESAHTRNIPVIFITGSDSSDDEVKGLTLGAVDYIRKPFVETVINLRVGIHLQLINQMRIIEQFSLTDGLTGVNNRRSFDQQLSAEWLKATRSQSNLGMLLLDIDKFKQFNDKFGHLNGDTCLKTVAQVMKDSVIRRTDAVFRWGGEEFAILLPNTCTGGTVFVAERIRKNIASTPISCGDETAWITASFGAGSIFPEKSDNSESSIADFCNRVDQALYRAKANGRNRVEVIAD